MTILLPRRQGAIGGPAAFVHSLARQLISRGHKIIHRPTADFDVLLATADCPLPLVLYARLRGKRIVHRLDGVYHPGLPGLTRFTYPLRNFRLRLIRNYFADHVIYQSQFAERACQLMLGGQACSTSIIYNGVALEHSQVERAELAAPQDGPTATRPIQLVTAANFRRCDQLQPILAALPHLKIAYELHIFGALGPRLRHIMAAAKRLPHIRYHGMITHLRLRRELPRFDIFLFSDQSACPNVVLEALAAAIPVVAYRRGSLPELIESGQSGELIGLPAHNPLRASYPYDENSFRSLASAIERVASDLTRYRLSASQRVRNLYDITDTAIRYESVLRPD